MRSLRDVGGVYEVVVRVAVLAVARLHHRQKVVQTQRVDLNAQQQGAVTLVLLQITLYTWCTVVSSTSKYDEPEVENVARRRSPGATFSASGHHI